MSQFKVWLGKPYPLGATWRGNGVNFALYSEHATAVDLCLFNLLYLWQAVFFCDLLGSDRCDCAELVL